MHDPRAAGGDSLSRPSRRERAHPPAGLRARRSANALWLLGILLSAGLCATGASPEPNGIAPGVRSGQEAPSDERLRKAWSYLLPDEQRDVVDWFSAEVEYLETAQMVFLRYALGALDEDPGLLPEAEPTAWFDPEVHAPGDVIRRRLLEFDSRDARRARERFAADLGAPRSAWQYHWGRGRIERVSDPTDPEHIFENALAGFPPGLDLGLAVVERELDDGALRTSHAAFAHAYTDRSGRVYPGVTLYDAWSSGQEFEMPDVDNLGIVHQVLDEWRKWVAPVPSGSKQKKLYEQVGELFVEVHRQRGLCEALARTYLVASPQLADGYEAALESLHWLWEDASSEPETLAKELPESSRWKRFLSDAAKQAGKSKNAAAAANRRAALAANEALVRGELVRTLEAYGALERTRRPSPPAPRNDEQE